MLDSTTGKVGFGSITPGRPTRECPRQMRALTAKTVVSFLPKCLPNPIGRRHYALADYKLCAHEYQRARPSHHRAPCLDEITDPNRVDKMDVELDGRLRLALVGIPTGSAHGAVGKRRQHAALHVAAAAAMLGLGQEGVAVAVARRPLPNWTDQVKEAVDHMALPAGAGGIEGRGRVGRLFRVNTHKPIVCTLRVPISGIADCCARAASGHATAAPPSSLMKSRRLNGSNCIQSPQPSPDCRIIELGWISQRQSTCMATLPNVPPGASNTPLDTRPNASVPTARPLGAFHLLRY